MVLTGVSVDWDFFFDEDASIHYDWGHRENALFMDHIWPWRFHSHWSGGKANGWPPEQYDLELAYQPDPRWEGFWKALEAKGFNFQHNALTVGESHLGGFYHMRASAEIYHFDFHNDVHYGAYPKWDKVDCANWLGALMHNGTARHVTVVYPTKERMEKEFEFHKNEVLAWIKRGRLRATYWDALEPGEHSVDFSYISRSGAWTPPWADPQFGRFVSDCPRQVVIPMEVYRKDLALRPREWNREEVVTTAEEHYQILAEQYAEVAASLKEKHKE